MSSFYLKHPTLGNRHVDTQAEADSLQAQGWTRWPRTKEQKEGKVAAPVSAEPIRNKLKLRQPK
jgi:hypothetical protein